MKRQRGFTLIEIMIVIVIIGILAAIAIPSYLTYTKKTAIQSCLYEVKGYSNFVYVDLYDQTDETTPLKPTINACQSITDASGWTSETVQTIVAKVKNYEDVTIECDLTNNVQCIVS